MLNLLRLLNWRSAEMLGDTLTSLQSESDPQTPSLSQESGTSSLLVPTKMQEEIFKANAAILGIDLGNFEQGLRALQAITDEEDLWEDSESSILEAIPGRLKALREGIEGVINGNSDDIAKEKTYKALNRIAKSVKRMSSTDKTELSQKIQEIMKSLAKEADMPTIELEDTSSSSSLSLSEIPLFVDSTPTLVPVPVPAAVPIPVAPELITNTQAKTELMKKIATLDIPGALDKKNPTLAEATSFFVSINNVMFEMIHKDILSEKDFQSLYDNTSGKIRDTILNLYNSEEYNEAPDQEDLQEMTRILNNTAEINSLMEFANKHGITAITTGAGYATISDSVLDALENKFWQQVTALNIQDIETENEPTLRELRNFLVTIENIMVDLYFEGKLYESEFKTLYATLEPLVHKIVILEDNANEKKYLTEDEIRDYLQEVTTILDKTLEIEALMEFATDYGITATTTEADEEAIIRCATLLDVSPPYPLPSDTLTISELPQIVEQQPPPQPLIPSQN